MSSYAAQASHIAADVEQVAGVHGGCRDDLADQLSSASSDTRATDLAGEVRSLAAGDLEV